MWSRSSSNETKLQGHLRSVITRRTCNAYNVIVECPSDYQTICSSGGTVDTLRLRRNARRRIGSNPMGSTKWKINPDSLEHAC